MGGKASGKGSDATISREQASAHRQERAITSRHSLDGCCTWEKKWTSSHYGVALDTKKSIFLCQKTHGNVRKKYENKVLSRFCGHGRGGCSLRTTSRISAVELPMPLPSSTTRQLWSSNRTWPRCRRRPVWLCAIPRPMASNESSAANTSLPRIRTTGDGMPLRIAQSLPRNDRDKDNHHRNAAVTHHIHYRKARKDAQKERCACQDANPEAIVHPVRGLCGDDDRDRPDRKEESPGLSKTPGPDPDRLPVTRRTRSASAGARR